MAAGSISHEDFKKAASYFIELSDRLGDSWQLQVTIIYRLSRRTTVLNTHSSSIRVLHAYIATRHCGFANLPDTRSRGAVLACRGRGVSASVGCHFRLLA